MIIEVKGGLEFVVVVVLLCLLGGYFVCLFFVYCWVEESDFVFCKVRDNNEF